jgi:hypothetical protein
VLTSAVKALGNPDDPNYGFASALLDSVVNGGLDAAKGSTNDNTGNAGAEQRNALDMQSDDAHDAGAAQQSDEILARRGREALEAGGTNSVANNPPPVLTLPPAARGVISTAFDDDGNLMPGVVDFRATPAQQQRQLTQHLMDQGLSLAQADKLTWQWASRDVGNSSNPLSTNGPNGEPRPQGPADWYTERAADGSPARPATAHEIARLENVMQRIRETEFAKVFDPVANPNQKLLHISTDGTWNDRDKQEIATNPAEIGRMLDRDLGDLGKSIYVKGIGSQGGFSGVIDGSVNAGPAGQAIVDDTYNKIRQQVIAWRLENPNTEVVVSMSAFSRGGPIATDLANRLQNEGIPDLSNAGKYLVAPGEIKFGPIMLYDPVDMTGGRLNVQLPSNVSSVLVIRAGSEYRSSFPATSVNSSNNPNDPRITTIEVPGAHTDAGRGYDQGIGNYTLQMNRDYFDRSGVPIGQLPTEMRPGVGPVLVHDSLTDAFGNIMWAPRSGGREVITAPIQVKPPKQQEVSP